MKYTMKWYNQEFDQQMTSGKISNALRCLDETQRGQVLALNDLTKGKSVYQILLDKHPQPSEVSENYIVSNQYENTLPYHSSIYGKPNASSIRKCAMKTRGGHGHPDWTLMNIVGFFRTVFR